MPRFTTRRVEVIEEVIDAPPMEPTERPAVAAALARPEDRADALAALDCPLRALKHDRRHQPTLSAVGGRRLAPWDEVVKAAAGAQGGKNDNSV